MIYFYYGKVLKIFEPTNLQVFGYWFDAVCIQQCSV